MCGKLGSTVNIRGQFIAHFLVGKSDLMLLPILYRAFRLLIAAAEITIPLL